MRVESTAPIGAVATADTTEPLIPAGLLEVLAMVPDPRKRRGRRHRLAGVFALALAATVTGARSLAAIAQWAADAPAAVLAGLGAGPAPSEATFRRLCEPDRWR